MVQKGLNMLLASKKYYFFLTPEAYLKDVLEVSTTSSRTYF